MQRKLLQSCDYCRAVNTIKGLLWTGSTVWKSVWQEHKSWCVCEARCTDSSRSAFQHNASFLLQWKTCELLAALQSHGADTQLCSPGSHYSAGSTPSLRSTITDIFNLQVKKQNKMCRYEWIKNMLCYKHLWYVHDKQRPPLSTEAYYLQCCVQVWTPVKLSSKGMSNKVTIVIYHVVFEVCKLLSIVPSGFYVPEFNTKT